MDLRILKPIGRTSAVIEIWKANCCWPRYLPGAMESAIFTFLEKAAAWGPHWITLGNLASKVFELLDVADEEMRQAGTVLAAN